MRSPQTGSLKCPLPVPRLSLSLTYNLPLVRALSSRHRVRQFLAHRKARYSYFVCRSKVPNTETYSSAANTKYSVLGSPLRLQILRIRLSIWKPP